MEHNTSLKALLIDMAAEENRDQIYTLLLEQLKAPKWAQNALGIAVTEEIKQDCLRKLLIPPNEHFLQSIQPLYYAQAAFENGLKNSLKKWKGRRDKQDSVQQYLVAQQEDRFPSVREIESRLDAKRALNCLDQLNPRQRIAVLLTHAPQEISEIDWQEVIGTTKIPTVEQSDDDASMFLFPPNEPESTTQEYQRRNSFRRLRKRAYAQLKALIEEDV